jgi:hypothetical protein
VLVIGSANGELHRDRAGPGRRGERQGAGSSARTGPRSGAVLTDSAPAGNLQRRRADTQRRIRHADDLIGDAVRLMLQRVVGPPDRGLALNQPSLGTVRRRNHLICDRIGSALERVIRLTTSHFLAYPDNRSLSDPITRDPCGVVNRGLAVHIDSDGR